MKTLDTILDHLETLSEETLEEYMELPVKICSEILVLNATYEPIHLTNWKRAIRLILKGKAIALDKRTVKLCNYVKLPVSKIFSCKPSRELIIKRDGKTCQYCGEVNKPLTLDHVLPSSRGGGNTWSNLVTSCTPCNNAKDNMTDTEWGEKILQRFDEGIKRDPAIPPTWDAFKKGMLEARIRRTGTPLSVIPKTPYNSLTIRLMNQTTVPAWKRYLFV